MQEGGTQPALGAEAVAFRLPINVRFAEWVAARSGRLHATQAPPEQQVRGQLVQKTRLGDANGSDQRLGPRRTEVLIGIGNRIRMSMPLHDRKWLQ